MKYQRKQSANAVAQHHGIFRRQLSMWEAVALIVSATIGAGVLGIPYVIAQVGVGIGLVMIILLGGLMTILNLFVGEIAVRTKQQLQLSGLSGRYLGRASKIILTLLLYTLGIGSLLAYIIGEGQVLAALFTGEPAFWSYLFFVLAAILIFLGLRTVKFVELFLTAVILLIVLVIALLSAPAIHVPNLLTADVAALLVPYGVILFAFHGVAAIPEAHSLLPRQDGSFKKAIIISGIVSTVVYLVFALVVVGVTGVQTTELATIGLGNALGPTMLLFGNVFAALAMGTSFLLIGVSLIDSLAWDFGVSRNRATAIVCLLPLLLFIFGARQFIATISLIGGVAISAEMIFVLLIYWKAKKAGDLNVGRYKLHHTVLLAVLLLVAIIIGSVYSVATVL